MNRFLSSADVNKMKKDEIVASLAALKLNSRGNKDELSKRLKSYWKRRKHQQQNASTTPAPDRFFDYLCVIDFECTCEGQQNRFNYPHEIIEFPAVLIRTTTGEIAAEFQSFCKPNLNPKLSDFCTYLTGITQDQVDAAPPFVQVLQEFTDFLAKQEMGTKFRFAFVTDGSADFGHFLQRQCQQCSIAVPHSMRYWINLRRTYCRFFKRDRTTLQMMLAELGLQFEGRTHSGLDDSRNIARIAGELLESGCEFVINERILRRDKLSVVGKPEDDEEDNQDQQQEKQKEKKEEDQDEKAIFDLGIASMHPASSRGGRGPRTTTVFPQLRLPYKVLTVSKKEFLHDDYELCHTCGEEEEEEKEEAADGGAKSSSGSS